MAAAIVVTDEDVRRLLFSSDFEELLRTSAEACGLPLTQDGLDAARLSSYLGALDYLAGSFETAPSTSESQGQAAYPLVIGGSYSFTIRKSSWQLLQSGVVLAAAFASLVSGDIGTGIVKSLEGVRELTTAVLGNWHKLSTRERTVVRTLMEHYCRTGHYPSEAELVAGTTAGAAHTLSKRQSQATLKQLLQSHVLYIDGKTGTVRVSL